MDEIMNLLNGIDLSGAEMTQALSEIGNGSMQDGLNNIFFGGFDAGSDYGYKMRCLEEAMESTNSNLWQKVAIGGIGLLAGAGITAGGIWLYKKLRKKKDTKALKPTAPIEKVCTIEVSEGENYEDI